MDDFLFLKILDKFNGLYKKLDVDYNSMRLILKTKLTMDKRRTTVMLGNQNRAKSENRNNFLFSLLFNLFFGLLIGMFTFFPLNKMYVYSLVYAMFIFLVLLTFISDFSSVLLDVRDKSLIGIRGVSNKTLNASKITHICYYIFLNSFTLTWLAIIGSFTKGLLQGVIFIISIIVIDLFMIAITALVYLFVLKFFNGEKVKDIINFVQIVLSIFMVVGYQLIGRVFQFVDVNIIYKDKLWNIFFIPMWFAAPLYALDGGKITPIIIILIVLGILMPIICISVYLKYANDFENYLSKLNDNGISTKEKKVGIMHSVFERLFVKREERPYFSFGRILIKRERELKLRMYPSLGLTGIFPLIFMFIFMGDHRITSLIQIKNILANSKYYLFIYFLAMMVPSIQMMLLFSKDFKASWIFVTTPLNKNYQVYKGVYKALISNLVLPIYIIESIIFILLFGTSVLIHLIIALLVIVMLIPISHKIYGFDIPFTKEFNPTDVSSGFIKAMISLILIIVFIIIHYILSGNILYIVIYGVILIGLDYVIWSKLK